jgi:hypothetical protein
MRSFSKRHFGSLFAFVASLQIGATLFEFPGAVRAEWAIAFAQGDGDGWAEGASWNAVTRQLAVNSAMASCSQKGSACSVAGQGENGCVALAVQDGGNGWSWARRESLGAAISVSMVACVKSNPLGCTIKVQFCDRTNGFQEVPTTRADREAFNAAVEQARLNRAREQVQQQSIQSLDQIINAFVGGASGALGPSERAPQFACRRPVDYEACIRQGVTGRGGGGPSFCHQQFC